MMGQHHAGSGFATPAPLRAPLAVPLGARCSPGPSRRCTIRRRAAWTDEELPDAARSWSDDSSTAGELTGLLHTATGSVGSFRGGQNVLLLPLRPRAPRAIGVRGAQPCSAAHTASASLRTALQPLQRSVGWVAALGLARAVAYHDPESTTFGAPDSPRFPAVPRALPCHFSPALFSLKGLTCQNVFCLRTSFRFALRRSSNPIWCSRCGWAVCSPGIFVMFATAYYLAGSRPIGIDRGAPDGESLPGVVLRPRGRG